MFCNYCGSPNPDDSSFCSACGKGIGAHANAPRPEIPGPVPAGPAASLPAPAQPPVSQPAQLPPPMQPQPPAAGKSKIGLWILVGFAACLVIVLAVAWGFRQNQSAPEQTYAVIPDSAPVQNLQDDSAAQAPPAAAPVAPVVDAAPAQAPPPPAAPQNPIVGQWKTTTLIGDTILTFTDGGRYTIKSALVSDAGVYVFSSGDGTLRLQPDAVFSHDVIVWQCQLSGDSLSVVDPDGAGHVYTRIQQ
jgi:hypothetical protein